MLCPLMVVAATVRLVATRDVVATRLAGAAEPHLRLFLLNEGERVPTVEELLE